ncbi:aldo/keto reductase [Arthrobacter sp. zg-Y750]|uniref:aldo/keto reductase n=1 Tax=Arthrobacter sp. zg-Y750 TaxID=2894189 RepID=UPI001E39ABD7|nr:aldo/keto reductase [Arthrobacter sp. zg-Y750]MCC9178470.1 aldo/keto reductase [Arthrobacter sp. zg-Y750]
MRYVKLGNSGATVSAIGLGCMAYGDPDRGTHRWTLREESARPLIRRAVELGINFFDTANVYSAGHSEQVLGAAVAEYCRRDEVVLATKVHGEMGPGPNGWGLSRKHILWQVDASLRRLGTDYIDLYQVHRWDGSTPLEETLATLDELVTAGKVRYLGASTMYAWQFTKALFLQKQHGWAQFITMQDHYNLFYREEEREMHPLCRDQGMGVLPYSPLARGRLARPWGARTARLDFDEPGNQFYAGNEEVDRRVADAVGEVAAGRGVSRARVALAWVLGNPAVTAPLVGATDAAQLDDDAAALDLQLTDEEFRRLEEDYVPRPVAVL